MLGDLNKISPHRDAYYSIYMKKYPNDTKTGSTDIAGKYYRFANETNIGDYILYPSIVESAKYVYIGKIIGHYVFNTKRSKKFPHQRAVKWIAYFKKSLLSEFAKRELGAARTFFKYKTHKDEIIQIMHSGYATDFGLGNYEHR